MFAKLSRIAALPIALAVSAGALAQDFYKDKTLRVIVGFSAGGGFDVYSRLIARHLGRHIPGSPSIVVDNMTGAGSLIAANHIYKAAQPNGLTMANFIGNLILGQILERPGIEFNALKFEYIGAPAPDFPVCALTKASGVNSLEKWLATKTPVKLGGTLPGSTTDDMPKVLRETLGLPIQLVQGYKGTADIRLAADRGEVSGGCWGWDSVRSTWRSSIESGEVSVMTQLLRPHPELPNVPLAGSFVKNEEGRQLLRVVDEQAILTRLYVFPPGTPKQHVQTVRRAFAETMKDPAFVAEAKTAKLDVTPYTGEEIEKIIKSWLELRPALVARLKQVIRN